MTVIAQQDEHGGEGYVDKNQWLREGIAVGSGRQVHRVQQKLRGVIKIAPIIGYWPRTVVLDMIFGTVSLRLVLQYFSVSVRYNLQNQFTSSVKMREALQAMQH